MNLYSKSLHGTLAAILVLFSIGAYAQQTGGKVVDKAGEGIIGASVVVDGTSKGAVTDLDGNFSINVPEGSNVTVSAIGYKSVKTALTQGMTVVLEEDSALLDEVVVVGYGVARKESLTGSVSVVKDDMLQNKGALSSPAQALQGQVPGVIVTRSSSAPCDESWSMSLRGSFSVNNSEPLIIIDGVAYESVNEMRLLNPSDIASMSFLKDGAAAIYGSRAAGGVILITTKMGGKGRAQVEYNGSFTVKTVGLMPRLMNIDQWSSAVMETLENDDNTSNVWYSYAQLARQYKGQYIDLNNNPNPLNGFTDVKDFVFQDVNWLNDLFGPSYSTSHDLSISGGSDAMTYRLSLGYLYDGSPLRYGNNNNQRYNLRLNNSFKITRWLSLDSTLGYNRQEQIAPTDVGAMLTTNVPMPGLPFFSKDGKPYGWGTWASPVSVAEYGGDNKLSVSAFNLSETLKATITEWLSANVNIGYSTSSATRNTVKKAVQYYNYAGDTPTLLKPAQEESYYKETSSRTNFYSVSGYFAADHNFGKHHVSGTLGAQYELKEYKIFGAEASDVLEGLEIINGSGTVKLSSPNAYKFAVASIFARFNYDYKNKYLLELNGRYDGSSKFLPKNRWAFFGGVSAAWRIGQEEFLKDADWLSELKLRASYGEVGNQTGIPNYDGVQLYNTSSNTGALVGGSLLSTIYTTGTFASSARTWERIKNFNLGLDLGFLENRFTASIDAFLKKNDNMLVSVEFPSVLGDAAPKVNQGKFIAYGAEGIVQWRDHVGRDFSYNIGGTFTYAHNELVDFGGAVTIVNGYVSNREGYPLNSLFGLQYGGKIQTEEQLNAYLKKYYPNNGIGMPANLRLGDNMFVDQNKDGKLDEKDYKYLGSDTPEIQYSFNAGIEYKGIDFSIVFQGAALRTMWNGVNAWTVPMRNLYCNTTTQSIGDTWSPTHRNAHYPSYTNDSTINGYNYQASSWSASDGAYLRLKNITLGYSLPSKLFEGQKGVSGCRFYFNGTDLWEYSLISDGWDPEAKSSPSSTSRYPFLRGFVFGVNLKF